MRSVIAGFAALAALVAPLPASAAVALSQTGKVSDIFLNYDGEFQFTVGLFNILGGVPGGSYNSVPLGGPPKTYLGPLLRYDVSFTTPAPIIDPSAGPIGAYWYDFYVQENGAWVTRGGNDGMDQSCVIRACGPVNVNGNTLSFSFLNQNYSSWGMFYSDTTAFYSWLDRIEITGDLPTSALDGNYTLTVAVSDVPEPATWALLMFGFAGASLMLRKTRRLRMAES